MPDCETVSLLAQVTENEFSYQMNLKVPFPVSDRETIQTVRFVEKPGELTVILTSCFDCIPENKGVIRIEKSYGTWIVRQVNPTEISLRFQYFTDPGGGVPAWLVNAFIVKSPHKTLINLRELLADDKN
jgi:hypothetical protein